MKERPILFNGAMVRAILDGTKTQTRRVVKGAPANPEAYVLGIYQGTWGIHADVERDDGVWRGRCPYGQPGDRLWVRETWYCDDYRVQSGPYLQPHDFDVAEERATGGMVYAADGLTPYEAEQPVWRPSIHMPRWACRLVLEITDVRVQRLQAINYEDAIAEGIPDPATCAAFPHHMTETPEQFARRKAYPQRSFAELWDSINGKSPTSWCANPWVWVVEFRKAAP